MRKTGKLLPEGQRGAATSSSPTSKTPMSSSLSSQSVIFVIPPPNGGRMTKMEGWLSSSSASRTPSTSLSTLHQKFAKLASIAAKVPLSKVPGASLCTPTPLPRWWHMLSMCWCDVGVKTVDSPPGINDVCFFFFFIYQPYHSHHPQHPHYLVNPPHPHQILLLLLPFIILQPSKIIRRKCRSPGDHSLSHQEQAQTPFEHVNTHFWHTLSLHTSEPHYESRRGELDQPEISLFHFDLQYDLVFALIVLASFCSLWIVLLNQLRFPTQIFHSSSSCHLRPLQGNWGEKFGTKFFVWTEGSNKELGFFSSPQK